MHRSAHPNDRDSAQTVPSTDGALILGAESAGKPSTVVSALVEVEFIAMPQGLRLRH